MSAQPYTRDVLRRVAAESTSLVDMLRRLDAPLGSRPLNYLRRRLTHYGIDTDHFVAEPLPPPAPRTYSRERLAEAAARSHSVREVLQHLGHDPRDSPYGHVRRRLDALGIDTGHFTSGRRHAPGLVPREACEAAVSGATSLGGTLRRLGIADSGAARRRLKRSLEAHGIGTDHFTGKAHARGSVSPRRLTAGQILRRREAGAPRSRTALLRRALDEVGVPRTCSACGLGEVWQGRRLVLEIDHVNGDRLDNRRENLRYLCPSCHSQTRAYASRSRRGTALRDPVQ